MSPRSFALALLLSGFTAASAHAAADNTAKVTPDQAVRTQVSGTGGAVQALPAPVKEDIGDIHPASAASWLSYFHLQATLNTEYTSNADLYHDHKNGDFLIAPSLQGDYDVPLNDKFSLDLAARAEDFTYADHQRLGFWGFSGNADLEYNYAAAWPRIYAGVEPYYYWGYSNGKLFTSAIGPVFGFDQSISINRGKTLFYYGYHFGQYFSSPGIDTRASNTLTLSLTQQLRRDWYGQLYYQFEYSDYMQYGRDETRNVFGGSLIHQFNPRTFASVFVNYVDNASNSTLAKYTCINAGVSLIWQY